QVQRSPALRQGQRDPPVGVVLAIVLGDVQAEGVRVKGLGLRHVADDYQEHLEVIHDWHWAFPSVEPAWFMVVPSVEFDGPPQVNYAGGAGLPAWVSLV